VIAKNTADGPASVLIPFLAEHGIVLADDNTASTNALTFDVLRTKKTREAENFREARTTLQAAVEEHIRGELQFLKSFYKPAVHKLGEWGATVNGNRIAYPTSLAAWITLLGNINTKHLSFPPGTSPLLPYLTLHGIVLTTDMLNLVTANTDNNLAIAADQVSEDATEDRDNIWNPVVSHLHMIGDFLMNLFKGNQKNAGLWGYTVDHSPRAPKLQTTSLKIGETKTKSSVTIGGTFTNAGAGDLHLYRGKTTSGTPDIIHAGEKKGMTQGFSIITVSNPNTLIPGKFTVLVSR